MGNDRQDYVASRNARRDGGDFAGERYRDARLSYIVCKDKSEENVLWVTEVWDREESHAASLTLPAVKAAMTRGRMLVANFEPIATTEPVWGHGLPTSESA